MHFLCPFFYCLKTTLYRVPLRALFFCRAFPWALRLQGPAALLDSLSFTTFLQTAPLFRKKRWIPSHFIGTIGLNETMRPMGREREITWTKNNKDPVAPGGCG